MGVMETHQEHGEPGEAQVVDESGRPRLAGSDSARGTSASDSTGYAMSLNERR